MNNLKCLAVTVGLLAGVSLAAQNIEENAVVREALDEMFEHLDKTRVPTGLLLDYGIDVLDFSCHDGSALLDSNYVDVASFESILRTVHSSAVISSPIGDVSEIMSSFSQYVAADELDVGIVAYRYNYIKENALEDHLISYEAGQVYDVVENDIWKNPYGEDYVIGFSPEANFSESGKVEYVFSSDYVFSNLNIRQMEFDADDGSGYVTVGNSSRIIAVYTTDGIKELRLRLTLDSGEQLVSHSYIVTTAELQRPSSTNVIALDEKWEQSASYNGTTVTAGISVKRAPGHSSIEKPYILVEGFDPWRLMSLTQSGISSGRGKEGFTGISDVYKWLSQYFTQNYDFIYIDWYDSEADIRANAKLLEEIIKNINAKKHAAGSNEKNIIFAQSMGGLVARYALCTMEKYGEAHETATFLTNDSPHLGANIPLGMLYGVHQLLSLYAGHSTTANVADIFVDVDINGIVYAAQYLLNSMSVKQMLLNYVDSNGNINHEEYSELQSELNKLGFPKGDTGSGIENLAVVNGNDFDQSPALNLTSNHYVYFSGYAKTSFLVDLGSFVLSPLIAGLFAILGEQSWYSALILGSTRLDLHFEVNPYFTHGGKVSELSVSYTKKFLWIIPIKYSLFYDSKNGSGLTYDSFPGSTYNLSSALGDGQSTGVINSWHYDKGKGGKYDFVFQMTDKFMFIPVASALYIKNGTRALSESNYTRNYYSDPPESFTECPFSGFYLYDVASAHIDLRANVYAWLEDQIKMEIVGDERAYDGTKYTVSGYNGPVEWRSLNEDVATIDPNTGVVTGTGGGFVTIMAQYYSDGKKYAKIKEIYVNFAPINLISVRHDGVGYVVSATTDAKSRELLESWVENGEVFYKWGVKKADEAIQWTETTEPEIVLGIPEKEEHVGVFLKLVDKEGHESKAYYDDVHMYYPYTPEYDCVVINKDKRVFFVKDETSNITYPNTGYILTCGRIVLFDTNTDESSNGSKWGDLKLEIAGSGVFLPGTMTETDTQYKWSFDLFGSEPFLQNVAYIFSNDNIEDGKKLEMKLILNNAGGEAIQIMHLPVLYKANFNPLVLLPGGGLEVVDPDIDPNDPDDPKPPIIVVNP